MSEPISVGDLVQVVRGHQCFIDAIGGRIFIVTEIVAQQGGGWFCQRCNTPDLAASDKFGARANWKTRKGAAIPLSWLKRIPPIDELEDEKQKEDLREPA